MKYGVLDEAGDTGSGSASSDHILVAVVLVGRMEHLHRAVSRTRRRLRKKKQDLPEFKAFKTDSRIVRRLLEHVAATECEIVSIIADKRSHAPGDDPEQLYRDLCARAAKRCLERHSQVSVVIDKRYTNPKLRARQNEAILEATTTLPRAFLVVEHLDSQQESALQAADAVAWALFQEYERGDESFYRLVEAQIVVEEVWR